LLTDFGCSLEVTSIDERIPKRLSDWFYRSPNRLLLEKEKDGTYHGGRDDLWAAGSLLLEFMLGVEIEDLYGLNDITILRDFKNLDDIKGHFKKYLGFIKELENPSQSSIWFLIMKLLDLDEENRISLQEAIKLIPQFDMQQKKKASRKFFNLY
jgi:serine/threonine protein kinase